MWSAPALDASHQLNTHFARLEMVNRAGRYIDDNIGEPVGLEDIARATGVSKFHLHRLFEEHSGSTLGRYLGFMRLKAALHLLSAADTRSSSVLDVALQVGFEDASAFSRSFHRQFGVTPSAVRQGHRPREFPVMAHASESQVMESGATVVRLPEFWVYGYQVGGHMDKSGAREAPRGFKLAWDAMQRHGIEGFGGMVGLPSYSWVLPFEHFTFLCGFRTLTRLGLRGLGERSMRAGKWLRARHVGPVETRWQTWQRLQIQQLRLGRPEDGRGPFEEELEGESRIAGQPCCDVYFPC